MSEPRDPDQPGGAAPSPPPPPAGDSTPSPGWGDPSTWSQPAPAVPPPQTAAGAPPRPRGRGWLVVLLVVLGLIVAMAAAGTVLFVTRTLPPYNAARHFLDDVSNDQSNASHLCAARADNPDQAVRQVRNRLESFGSIHNVAPNVLGVDRAGSTAKVDFVVNYNGGRSSRTFSLLVVDEHGSWKACP